MLRSLMPWTERPWVPSTRLFNRVDDELESLVERLVGHDGGWLRPSEGFVPSVDVAETENELTVSADLPGMKPENVTVEVKDGSLWISGKTEEEKEEKGKTFHRIERSRGEFRRILPLPPSIDENSIEAKFEDGVLKIAVPKTEAAKTKHIEVK